MSLRYSVIKLFSHFFHQGGFTLTELLIVTGIITSMIVATLLAFTNQATRTKASAATSDMSDLVASISLLQVDTNRIPGGLLNTTCQQNLDTDLTTCEGGIVAQDASGTDCTTIANFGTLFPGWRGPYTHKPPLDPWGNSYNFDPDYRCHDYVRGCEDLDYVNANPSWVDGSTQGRYVMVRAIVSPGLDDEVCYATTSDGVGFTCPQYRDQDNVVTVLCISQNY